MLKRLLTRTPESAKCCMGELPPALMGTLTSPATAPGREVLHAQHHRLDQGVIDMESDSLALACLTGTLWDWRCPCQEPNKRDSQVTAALSSHRALVCGT